MRIVLRQSFPLGRFHANPWRTFPFEDPHGEWPPSPWRLLRATLARSYQLEREQGVDCEAWRASLVGAFCTSKIGWHLPPFSWRGPPLRQYQPAEFSWDPPNRTKRVKGRPVNIPAEMKYRPTLVQDNYWLIDRSKAHDGLVWWLMEGEHWSDDDLDLLDASLDRMTYFGRAEAITEIKRVEELPKGVNTNCVLEQLPSSDSVPVLVPTKDATLAQVQAVTDDPSVKNSTVPPGARWMRATRPVKPRVKLRRSRTRPRVPIRLVQFAIGSRVSPPRKSIVTLTSRFRGRVIGEFLGGSWKRATEAQRNAVRLLTGKEADGSPLRDSRHPHSRFGILFDRETGKVARLLVWRDEPFTDNEQHAILRAAERELPLSYPRRGTADPWTVKLVPLDSGVPPPPGFDEGTYRQWESETPYVPSRHMYDRRGRVKVGESVEDQVRRELKSQGYDTSGLTISVEEAAEWTRIHEPQRIRDQPTNNDRRGYRVSLDFRDPVSGPIALGHSSHFGLGLFVAVND